MRIGMIYQTATHSSGSTASAIVSPGVGEDSFVTITLECAEGQTVGPVVEFSGPASLAENRHITFVPACLTTREDDLMEEDEEGNVHVVTPIPGPVDPDGACVTTQESFMADFGNVAAEFSIPYLVGASPKIRWQKRKLLGNGTLESNEDGSPRWTLMTYDHDNKPYEGAHVALRSKFPGIYQLQALMVLPTGDSIEFPFVRLRDDKSIQNSADPPVANPLQKAGSPDFFGIAKSHGEIQLRDKARAWLGSRQYSREADIVANPTSSDEPSVHWSKSLKGADKCNVFVAHVANTSGSPVPYWKLYGVFFYAPIARDDWFKQPGEHIDLERKGWSRTGMSTEGESLVLTPGDVIAGYGTGRTNGHMGILDYDGTWIGAGASTVNKSINLQNMDAHYKPFAIRNYVSEP